MMKRTRTLLIVALLGFSVCSPAKAVAQEYFHGDWALTACEVEPTTGTLSETADNIADAILRGLVGEGNSTLLPTTWMFEENGNLRIQYPSGNVAKGKWSYGNSELSLSTGQPGRVRVERFYQDRPVRFVGTDERGKKVTFWRCIDR